MWAITQSKVCSIPRLLYWDGCLHRNNNWNMKPGHVHTQSSCCEKYVTCWLNVGDLTNHPGCQWRTKHSWEPSPRPPQPRVTQYAAGSLCQCENPPSRCSTRLSQWTHLLRFSSATLNLQQIQRSLPKTACSSSEMSSSIFAKRRPSGPPEAPVPHPPSMPWPGAGTKGRKCLINSRPPLSDNPRDSPLLRRNTLVHPSGLSRPSRAERSRYTPHSSEWAWQSLLVPGMTAFLCWSSDDVILSRSLRSLPLSLPLSFRVGRSAHAWGFHWDTEHVKERVKQGKKPSELKPAYRKHKHLPALDKKPFSSYLQCFLFDCCPLLKCKATILPVSNVPITLRIWDLA